MKIIFAILLAATFYGTAYAKERSHEFSVGPALGLLPPAPWASTKFRNSVSFLGLRGGVWARYHMPYPEGSFEVSTDRLDFAKSSLAANVLLGSIFWRFQPESNLHPIFDIGYGIAFAENYFTSGNCQLSVFRIRVGAEYELQPQLSVAGYLDHFSIFRNKPADPDAHALSPSVAVIYYFSAPAAPAPATKTASAE